MSATTVQTALRDPAVQAALDSVLSTPSSTLLERARSHTSEQGLRYAGGLIPAEAWALVSRGDVVFVDVRTTEERKFVGHVPDTPRAMWQTGSTIIKNSRFLRELEKAAPKSAVVLLLCRSGKRSVAAVEAATVVGFQNVFNVLEGFEGDPDEQQQRGEAGDWYRWGLPWQQDWMPPQC